jgi:hypothetical protein
MTDRVLSPDILHSHFSEKRGQQPFAAARTCCPGLSADTEFLDDGAVPLNILLLQVIEKTPPLPDDLEKPPTGMMVFFVGAKMFGQVSDTLGKERDLHFRRTRVPFVSLELIDDFLFTFCGQHCATSFHK